MYALTVKERFWSKVNLAVGPDECWTWQASLDGRGYGQFSIGQNRMYRAHRLALELTGIEVPPNSVVCHRCDNKRCVNPGHLYVGTKKTNAADAVARGQVAHGQRNARSKLTEAQVSEVILRLRNGETQRSVADHFGVSQGAIWEINAGHNWVRTTAKTGLVPSSHRRGSIGEKNHNARLTEQDVKDIRYRVQSGEAQSVVAMAFGLKPPTVNAIVKGRNWKHVL